MPIAWILWAKFEALGTFFFLEVEPKLLLLEAIVKPYLQRSFCSGMQVI